MSKKGSVQRSLGEVGFAPILIVLLIAVLVIGGVFVYEKHFDKSYLAPEDAAQPITQPSPSPDRVINVDPNMYDQVTELNGAPVYPGAVFVDKKYFPALQCYSEQSGGVSTCKFIVYTFETRDDYDQVSSWYREDKSGLGWKCSGGAGSYGGPRDAGGTSSCKKDTKNYGIEFMANSVKTSISIRIPLSDYKGKYLN